MISSVDRQIALKRLQLFISIIDDSYESYASVYHVVAFVIKDKNVPLRLQNSLQQPPWLSYLKADFRDALFFLYSILIYLLYID